MQMKQVVEITGVCMRKIISWCEFGLVKTPVNARGAGHFREFNDQSVIEILTVRNLYKMGLTRHLISDIMDKTRGHLVGQKGVVWVDTGPCTAIGFRVPSPNKMMEKQDQVLLELQAEIAALPRIQYSEVQQAAE